LDMRRRLIMRNYTWRRTKWWWWLLSRGVSPE
jgi:hypothetical protein